MMVIANMKPKLNVCKLGKSAEKTGFLIKSEGFEKWHKPVSSHMLGETGNAALKVGTSGIPVLCMDTNEPPNKLTCNTH
jgi:hypothetical protein